MIHRILLEETAVEGGGRVADKDFFVHKPPPDNVKQTVMEIDDDDLSSINSPIGGPNVEEGDDGGLNTVQPYKLQLKDDEDEDEDEDEDTTKKDTKDTTTQAKKEEESVKTDTTKVDDTNKASTKTTEKKTLFTAPPPRNTLGQKSTTDSKESEPRDYSLFPAEVAEAIKKTPNSSFGPVYDFVKKTVEERNTLQKEYEEYKKGSVAAKELDERGTPLSYYQHPHAFTLTPEYQQSVTMAQRAAFQQQHWGEQLARIEAGEPWQAFKGWTKDGQPVLDDKLYEDFSGRAKAHVIGKLNQSANAAQQYQSYIHQLAGSFQERHNGAIKYLADLKEKHFAWHKDKKAPQWEAVNTFVNDYIPPEFRNHPMTEVAAFMYSLVVDFNNYINEQNVAQAKETKIKEEETKLEETVKTTVTEIPPQQRRQTGLPTATGRNRVIGEIDLTALDED